MSSHPSADTPVMRQYLEVKDRYPDCIVFFRLGDFYEMFFDDAVFAAQALDLTLTSRDKNKENPIPMCGVPYHAAKQYLGKLVDLGKKVAICEQVEDPRLAKKIVRRAVTQVVTPGVVLDEEQLSAKSGHYLTAVAAFGNNFAGKVGIASLDVSTGEFVATQVLTTTLLEELGRIDPAEILLVSEGNDSKIEDLSNQLNSRFKVPLGKSPLFQTEIDRDLLNQVLAPFATSLASLEKLSPPLLAAAAACIRYAQATQLSGILPVRELRIYEPEHELLIDESTRRHLELFQTSFDRKFHGSLLSILDFTKTAPGGRLFRRWLGSPSQNLDMIQSRHDAVGWLFTRHQTREALQKELAHVFDLERLTGRLTLEVATPRDVARLGQGLRVLPKIQAILQTTSHKSLTEAEKIPSLLELGSDLCVDVASQIAEALVEEPPAFVREGGLIRRGYHKGLDELLELASGGRQQILAIEERERALTGIPSLKIQYNRVFGYFIEVTRTHLAKVPSSYIRKQTLAQAERFITPELSEYEARVLGAEEQRLQLEQELFEALRKRLIPQAGRLLDLAAKVALLDTLCSLAEAAHRFGYVRPQMNHGLRIEIEEGRHPVVEQLIPTGRFVPNDTLLDPSQEQICLITGPNMAGKSTIMRQVALICILAQMGSFVPAKRACLGILDRVFTRVGAADNLAAGESTFMVEMRETSQILKAASRRSLVILDEIGRGTSTYDGISIAWAVIEYLHDVLQCKTLFATHYHELCALAESHERVFNTSVAVKQSQGDVIFLHRLIEGGASRSYGIEVAKLAGLPAIVLARAHEVLRGLETGEGGALVPHHENLGGLLPQLPLFGSSRGVNRETPHLAAQETILSPRIQVENEVLTTLRELNSDELSPKQAMLLILDLTERLREKTG